MSRAGHGDLIAALIENVKGHADEHVLADVGKELAVHRRENFGRRREALRDGAQRAATHRHQQTRRHSLARHIGNCDAMLVVAEIEVIVIIATDNTRRYIDPADPVAGDHRFLLWQENPLNLACIAQLNVHLPFLLGIPVQLRGADGKGRLFGRGTENREIVGHELPLLMHSRHRHHSDDLAGVAQGRGHQRDIVTVIDQAVAQRGMTLHILDVNWRTYRQAIAEHALIKRHPRQPDMAVERA